ncbi:MAG: hypothetical protein JXA57_10690 [Armatimonadetes bacterium]|nr:hypothetical protein [Armatimonadota bacterium]
MRGSSLNKIAFAGTVTAVKARIRLLRSFDQVSHAYLGYALVLDGTVDGVTADELRVAVGPKAHETHRFRIGDQLQGMAQPVAHPNQEWATHYKVSGLQLLQRGPADQDVPANPEGGTAPPLPDYRAQGHLRLDTKTYRTHCQHCPFGLVMATEITIDQWNPSKKRWRFETHCYGPRDCPRYKPGKPYKVQGRKSWMVWEDDDVERAAEDEQWRREQAEEIGE